MNRYPKEALVWRPRITRSDATQRRPWEDLTDLRDVSEETFLINLPGDASKIANEPSLRCLWDVVWGVSKMHLRCTHAGWVSLPWHVSKNKWHEIKKRYFEVNDLTKNWSIFFYLIYILKKNDPLNYWIYGMLGNREIFTFSNKIS